MALTARTPPPNKRRGPPKPHQPYNDGLEYGKRTGKAVPVSQVPQDEDGMEDFDRYFDLEPTTESTPIHRAQPADHQSSRGSIRPDDFGEMSMDTDTGDALSPSAYFNRSAPRPPSTIQAGSYTRPVDYHPDVDYDSLPGGSADASQRRRSAGPTSARRTPALSKASHNSKGSQQAPNGSQQPLRTPVKSSQKSQSAPAPDITLNQIDRGNNSGNGDMEDFGGNGHEYGDNFDNDGTGWDEPSMTNGDGEGGGTDVEEEAPKASSRRGKVAATDDDVEDRRARSKAKGKGRAPVQDEAEEGGVSEVEEDIQQGLEALDMEDDEEEEEPQKPGPSKRRKKNSDEKKPAKPVVSRKSRRLEAPNRSPTPPGVRRSHRDRHEPLEWWRLERYVYSRGRRESGPNFVPIIADVIRIPKEEPKPLGIHGRSYKRKRSASVAPVKKEIVEVEEVPEKGWDDQTKPHGVILDYTTGKETTKLLAVPADMVEFKDVPGAPFKFQKIFGDSDFIAAGMVSIPVGGQKPSKPTKDNTYMFYCIEGAVQVKVHRASFVIAPGGMFTVPRGNQYFIKNISQREARLFFAQARKMVEERGTSIVAPSSGSRHSALMARQGLSVPPNYRPQMTLTPTKPGQSSIATEGSPRAAPTRAGANTASKATLTAAKKAPAVSAKKAPPLKK